MFYKTRGVRGLGQFDIGASIDVGATITPAGGSRSTATDSGRATTMMSGYSVLPWLVQQGVNPSLSQPPQVGLVAGQVVARQEPFRRPSGPTDPQAALRQAAEQASQQTGDIFGVPGGDPYQPSADSSPIPTGTEELDAAIGESQRDTTEPAVTAPPAGYAAVDGEMQVPAPPISRRVTNGMIFGLKYWQAALIAGGLIVGGILVMRR